MIRLGMIWIASLAVGVLLLLGGQHWYYSSKLSRAVAAIRERGEPLEPKEIEAFYRIPDGAADLTAEYEQALESFYQWTLNHAPTSDEENLLPYVGKHRLAKPTLVGPDWDLRPAAQQYLASVDSGLDQLRALASKPGAVRYQLRLAEDLTSSLPDRDSIRDAADSLRLDFKVQLAGDNREKAFADLLAIIALGETLREEPLILSQLIRHRCIHSTFEMISDFLAEGKASCDQLAQLEKACLAPDFAEGMHRALIGERAFTNAIVQRQSKFFNNNSDCEMGGFMLFGIRPGYAARLLELEAMQIEASQEEYPAAIDGMNQVRRTMQAENQATLIPFTYFPALLLPDPMPQSTARTLAWQRCVQTVLVIEKENLQAGKRPTTWEEIVPRLMTEQPLDPFTGMPLLMKATADCYVVYSAGEDGIDQGGPLDERGAFIGIQIRIRPNDCSGK